MFYGIALFGDGTVVYAAEFGCVRAVEIAAHVDAVFRAGKRCAVDCARQRDLVGCRIDCAVNGFCAEIHVKS